MILSHLFGGHTRRFSELERAIPGISQKMLSQQLRQLQDNGIVTRTVHPEVPPKVEYQLTEWVVRMRRASRPHVGGVALP